MSDFSYKIDEEIAVLSEKNGYTKELNKIAYGSSKPKYDIRSWHTDEETGEKRMSKGITLSDEEAIALRDALNEIDFEA